jgi:hypothetical protein
MNEPSRQPRATQALYTMAAFVIVIAGIKSAESIMVTFLLSAFFCDYLCGSFLNVATPWLACLAFYYSRGTHYWLNAGFVDNDHHHIG